MQRKTDSTGYANVITNTHDRAAMARVSDYFFLQAACMHSNSEFEEENTIKAIGQRIQDELRHVAKRAKLDTKDVTQDGAETPNE